MYKALKEMTRVARKHKYLASKVIEMNRKANLLYWQVTCEAFNTPKEWEWWFDLTGYDGDYIYIFQLRMEVKETTAAILLHKGSH